jgi:hypothetical protein
VLASILGYGTVEIERFTQEGVLAEEAKVKELRVQGKYETVGPIA